MILDDKGRLFGKVSIIDIFVIVMLAAVVSVVYLKIGNSTFSGVREPEQKVRIKFFTPTLENFTVDAVKLDDIVISEGNNNTLGRVIDIKTGDSFTFNPDTEGNLIASPLEGYSAFELTTEVTGKLNEGAVIINGNNYTSGTELVIRAGKAKIFLKISGVEAVK